MFTQAKYKRGLSNVVHAIRRRFVETGPGEVIERTHYVIRKSADSARARGVSIRAASASMIGVEFTVEQILGCSSGVTRTDVKEKIRGYVAAMSCYEDYHRNRSIH